MLQSGKEPGGSRRGWLARSCRLGNSGRPAAGIIRRRALARPPALGGRLQRRGARRAGQVFAQQD